MQIQVNTDGSIEGSDQLRQEVEPLVRDALDRFRERITRVEVHLSDENGDKKSGPDEIRCLLEARPSGMRPIAVSHEAATIEKAVDGAAKKMERALERTLARLGKR